MEIWKDIEGYEGTFQVSNTGRVRSVDRIIEQTNPQGTGVSKRHLKGKILKSKVTKFGYLEIQLYDRHTSKKRSIRVHQIVAKTFLENSEGKPCINHINGNKQDNSVNNLEWCSYQENMVHAHSNGLIKYRFGEQHQNTKITEDDVRFILKNHKYRDKTYSAEALGRKFGVCTQTVLNIVNRKTWKNIEV